MCYTACSSTVRPLQKVKVGGSIRRSNYRLVRFENSRFRFYFNVLDGSGEEVASLKFGLHTETATTATEERVFICVLNAILYDQERLKALLAFSASIGLSFHHFTSLDLAVDSSFNASSFIKRSMRDKTLTTIINGKRIRERDRVLTGVFFQYSSTLNRLKNPSVTIKQKKAIRNKRKGTVIQAYDKLAEIEHQSNKQYILDFYGRPKRLHRLEVRLGYQELRDYLCQQKSEVSPDILFQQSLLREMFFYHLSSVIRFARGRVPIRWEDVIKMGPIVPINNSPCQCTGERRKLPRRGSTPVIGGLSIKAENTHLMYVSVRPSPRRPHPINRIPSNRSSSIHSTVRCPERRE